MKKLAVSACLGACLLFSGAAMPDGAAHAASAAPLSVRPVASYGTPAFPHTADTAQVPEVLVVVRNDGQDPVTLRSGNGRSPRFIVQCFLGPRRRATDRIDCPVPEPLPERVVLRHGDSLYLAVPVLFETAAFRLRFLAETSPDGPLADIVSDTVDVATMPLSQLIDRDEPLRVLRRAHSVSAAAVSRAS